MRARLLGLAGTAGRPMLDVLRHQDLEGVLATVVRYFGGVKLGAGGLVRAYTDTVAQALLSAQKVALVQLRNLQCELPYALEGLLRRELELAGAQDLEVTHASLVRMRFRLPKAQADALLSRLAESGQGRIGWSDAAD
jgi:putative IMPACT (imprinted ancient) family translation regulator